MDEEKLVHARSDERVVELRIHEDEKKSELENTWRSGCLTMDKRATLFFTQLAISVAVMTFCVVELTTAKTCEETNTWISLLMFILGIWIKAPTM